jgi:PAS domain S-box-containing protein
MDAPRPDGRTQTQFRNLADAAQVLLWITDVHKKGVWFNRGWLTFVGRALDEQLAAPWFESIHPTDLPRVTTTFSTHFDEHSNFTIEFRLRRADGTFRWLHVSGTSLYDELGAFTGYIHTAVDITEHKNIEDALKATRDQLDLSIASADLGTFHCPAPMDKIYWNDVCKAHFWLPPDAVVDFELFYSIIHPDDRARTRHAVNRALLEQVPYDIEYRAVAPDGRIRWIRAKGRAQHDAFGNPSRFDGITLDITPQKLAEAERLHLLEDAQRARLDAENASRMKDDFLATLSHELRTPLAPVLPLLNALEKSPPDSLEKLRSDLAIIRRNVELDARLIDDLLDLTRISRGKLELMRTSVDAHQVVAHALSICQTPESREKRLIIETDFTASHVTVFAESTRLEQIFWNLISNAIKFTPPHGTIRVATRNSDNDHLEITVSDNGAGIDPDTIPRLFSAFEQGDRNVTRRFGGLGLGLAICKALTQLHHGTITATSPGKGHGATFTVTLPLTADQIPAERAPIPAPVIEKAPARLRILLVEDHIDTGRVMTRLLKAEGHDVIHVDTVAAALERARTHTFDLFVTDLGLPDGSGYDILAQLRPLPGIALSGFGMESDLQRSRDAGFCAHLVKPINFPTLLQEIAKCV